MANKANIASVEALDEFRSYLIVYITKAAQALDEIADEVRRVRQWMEGEQRLFWEREIKQRRKKFDQVTQELISARFSTLRESTTTNEMAVERARRAMRDAEDKLRVLKKWYQSFPSTVEPLARKLDKMRNIIATDLPRGVAYLAQIQKTLQSYAELNAPGLAGPQPNTSSEEGSPS